MGKSTIVIGTSNPGKIAEIMRFLGDLAVVWQPMSEQSLGITVAEDADTFEANAIEKAVAFARATNLPALAGDGGMEIPALNNWPGVRSRRLDGSVRKTDDELIEIMQAKVTSLPVEDRAYRFITVFVFATPDGSTVIGRGEHTGILTEKLHNKIEPGFPYRRFWFIPTFGTYFYDLTSEEYNTINHNRIALDQLRPAIETYVKEANA